MNKKDQLLTQNDQLILAGIISGLVAIGMAGISYQDNRNVNENVQKDVQQLIQDILPGSQAGNGIMSIKFTDDEAKELSAILSNEKAMARILVKRVANSMTCQDTNQLNLLNENLRATLHTDGYEKDNL